MSQSLNIKSLSNIQDPKNINLVSQMLNDIEKHQLDYVPWTEYPYKPMVYFSIAHFENCILLKFFVQEKQIRAINHTINSPIWEDSCVEFFISFDNGQNYYNIEFNCIGTGLIGYGKSKTERVLLDVSIINQVKTLSVINSEKNQKASWELTMSIPLTVFEKSSIDQLENLQCRANFYKCGDMLPDPHYISWTNIDSEFPNFHLPNYFGNLQFT